jgi:hypothetical protein
MLLLLQPVVLSDCSLLRLQLDLRNTHDENFWRE